jgi:hypothetical protein
VTGSNQPLKQLSQLLFVILLTLSACNKKADVKAEATRLEAAFSKSGSNDFMGVALSAIRKEDYVDGVIALESAKRIPGMTAEQLISVQNTTQAIISDLVARAARGDAKAQADLAAIERSRSQ